MSSMVKYIMAKVKKNFRKDAMDTFQCSVDLIAFLRKKFPS